MSKHLQRAEAHNDRARELLAPPDMPIDLTNYTPNPATIAKALTEMAKAQKCLIKELMRGGDK